MQIQENATFNANDRIYCARILYWISIGNVKQVVKHLFYDSNPLIVQIRSQLLRLTYDHPQLNHHNVFVVLEKTLIPTIHDHPSMLTLRMVPARLQLSVIALNAYEMFPWAILAVSEADCSYHRWQHWVSLPPLSDPWSCYNRPFSRSTDAFAPHRVWVVSTMVDPVSSMCLIPGSDNPFCSIYCK